MNGEHRHLSNERNGPFSYKIHSVRWGDPSLSGHLLDGEELNQSTCDNCILHTTYDMLVFSSSHTASTFDYSVSKYVVRSNSGRPSKVSDGLYLQYRFQPETLIRETSPFSVFQMVVLVVSCFGCSWTVCSRCFCFFLAVVIVLRVIAKDKSVNKRDCILC